MQSEKSRMAPLEKLVSAGSYSLIPQSLLEKGTRMKFKMGLYTLLCYVRYGSAYEDEHAFTEEEVDKVFSCAKLFKSGIFNSDSSESRPLDLVVHFCCGKHGGEGRHTKNPLLQRIKKLGYECKPKSNIARRKTY